MVENIIPFGPQHPVFPEPVHFKLTLEDERVKSVVPTVGYIHRGLETLVTKKDFRQMVQVVERVCGICSAMHGLCYSQGIEEMMNVEVPDRAKLLRVIWTELHRLHSHLLWFGLYADAFGFESLFMQFWKIREKIMDINEATTGSRIIVSVNIVGGVRRDISDEHISWILATLKDIEKEIKSLSKVVLDDYTIKKRTVDIGYLPEEKAFELGAVGPMARGSGLKSDMRMLGYAAFPRLNFEPVVEYSGDCYARAKVRYRELLYSIDLIRQAIAWLPTTDNALANKITGFPDGEVVTRVEQPRGECLYYLRGNGTANLARCRIRTPSFANFPPVMYALKDARLADVPVIILSIDPCISCTER